MNPEPLGCTRGLELVERQASAFMMVSRRVHFDNLESERYVYPVRNNAPPVESLWVERLEFLTGFTLRSRLLVG